MDYATATAVTTYGCIGIKVWIYKGRFGEVLVVQAGNKPRRQARGEGGGGRHGGPGGAGGSGRGGPGGAGRGRRSRQDASHGRVAPHAATDSAAQAPEDGSSAPQAAN